MQETWVRSMGQGDPLEKEMVTYSSIFPWEIPWTEEPVDYSSWGHKRVGLNNNNSNNNNSNNNSLFLKIR